MRIVLDTNILLQSLARKSKIRPVWDAYLNKDFKLIITPSILLEYEEIIAERTSAQVSANVISLLSYLVTNDGHFKQALKIEFPRINIINGEQFLSIIQNNDK